jgi:hypothetical protein
MVCMSQPSYCTALVVKSALRHTSVTWPYSPSMLYRMGKMKGSLTSMPYGRIKELVLDK